jgi:hypothetical protein
VAKIQTFDRQVGFRDIAAPDTRTGLPDMWGQLAQVSARVTNHLNDMADKAAALEGEQAGALAAGDAALPAVPLPDVNAASPAAAVAGTAAPAAASKGKSGRVPNRASEARAFFESKGFGHAGASAITGNLLAESGLNTGAFNPRDPGGSIGIGQWNRERKAAYMAFAKAKGTSWRDFRTQLEFVAHELNTSEGKTGAALRRATTVEDATAIAIGYERPQGWTPENPRGGHNFSGRLTYAQQVFGLARGGVPISPPSLPAAASVPAKPQPAAAAGGDAPPPAAPFQLTHSFTIRGQAYDNAAQQIYGQRLETKALADLEQIATANPGAPEAVSKGIDDYRKTTRASLPAELRPSFDLMVGRHQIAYVRDASREHARKLEEEGQATFLQTYSAKRTALVQLAARAGDDELGNAAVADELRSIEGFIQGSQDLKPTDRVKLAAELHDDVLSARVLSQFQGLRTAGERQAYADKLQQEWQSGSGLSKDVTPEAFTRIQSQMTQVLARDETTRLRDVAAADRKVDGVLSRLKAGFGVPETERAALKAEVAGLQDPALGQQWQFFEGMANWQAANRHQRPEQIAQQIQAYQVQVNAHGATDRDVVALDTMKGLYKAAVDGLDKDPLGWAEQSGRITIEPLDMTSGETFAKSLVNRAADAHAVAQSYGQTPRFFRPAEKEALTKAIADNPDMLVEFAPTLRKALGEQDTPLALAEISKDAPVLAHVAGLAMATGNDSFLRETAQALKVRKVDGYAPVKMPPNDRADLPALAALPATETAAVKTAELVFDMRARAEGVDPAKDQLQAAALWADTLNDALGATTRGDGTQAGGLGLVNGLQTLLPTAMSAEDVQTRLHSFSSDLFSFQPPLGSSNGIAISASQIQQGHLVAVAPGRYRVALGDPASDNPRYVMNKEGGFWLLDVTRIPDPGSYSVAPSANGMDPAGGGAW